MNLNNIFAGLLSLLISITMIYLFWTPINTLIDGIGTTEVAIFISVLVAGFFIVATFISPLNMATSDDTGNN